MESDVNEYYKTTIELNKAHVAAFREMFPQQGSIKWFFQLCLENFVNIHRPDETNQEIRSAVSQAVEDMGDEKAKS